VADPIELQVVQSVQAALQAISVGGGYFYDVRGSAVKLNPDYDVEALVEADAPRPWITLEITPETWEYQPSQVVELEMPLRVHWFGEVENPTSDEDVLRMVYRAFADIERAITQDPTRGGLASDTRITQRVATSDGSAAWIAVDLVVWLSRTFGEASA
jgi:hypothetical protein